MERAINGSTRDDEFVDIAVDLASDIVRLERIRTNYESTCKHPPSWMSNVIASFLMLIFGVCGYLMRKLDYPLAPAVLAIVLGPLAEASMRQSLIMEQGSFAIFFNRPIAGTIMIAAIALLFWPLVTLIRKRMAGTAA